MNIKYAGKKVGFIATVGLLLFLVAGSVTAATIYEHVGGTDPDSEGWLLSALGENSTAGSAVTHLGENAWKMTDMINNPGTHSSNYVSFGLTAADFDDPTGWTLSWRVAFGNLKVAVDDEAGIRFQDGHIDLNYVYAANGTTAGAGAKMVNRLTGVTLIGSIPTIASRATGFNDFALDFNPGSGVYSLYMNGSFVTNTTLTPGLVGGSSPNSEVRWGGLGGGGDDIRNVDSYWASVKLATGTVPVPEPTSISLIAVGICGVIALKCWRRKK